ncbi:hypothetical protein ACFST9_15385 [Hymenobacter monticola]|uniref:Outer membrane protein assembly factor BamE n=1 Tax=Hymenobacter monticola TaxID=1705399 RepID=A0ABY4B0R0_9BACT|nr:hypothetical protein [Hymenobacter monticola]UOE32704.1 hypothetical protein MTP16_16395 [Hymenobacter monticola]
MKQLLQLVPLLLCLGACESHPDTAATAKPAPPIAEPANTEHIEADTLTITGLPTKEISTTQLTSQLGRPDSIAKGAVECGGSLNLPMDAPDGDVWHYGKTRYEVNGSRAIMLGFDVRSGKFKGKLGKLVLDKKTTLEDVRRFYPESAKEADKPAGHGLPNEMMSLPFYEKGVPVEGALELIFEKGRLQVVEFFNPC